MADTLRATSRKPKDIHKYATLDRAVLQLQAAVDDLRNNTAPHVLVKWSMRIQFYDGAKR